MISDLFYDEYGIKRDWIFFALLILGIIAFVHFTKRDEGYSYI